MDGLPDIRRDMRRMFWTWLAVVVAGILGSGLIAALTFRAVVKALVLGWW